MSEPLEKLVAWLADPMENNWTRMISHRDAADAVLEKMAALGLLEHRRHRHGGDIWTVNGVKYGRTED